MSKSDALGVFESLDESYKGEIINDSDQEDNFQLYYQDNDEFVDLCRGPHLTDLNKIGAFKLTKVSGAYWRGSSDNKCLQEFMELHGRMIKILKIFKPD